MTASSKTSPLNAENACLPERMLHDGPGVPPGVGVLPSPSILNFLLFFFFSPTAGLPPYSPS
jgi:hypothetical protein